MINTLKVTNQSTIVQSQKQLVSDMDGEKVMLSITNGKYYNLGDIGGDIWELLERPILVKELVTTLLSKYEVDHAECEIQVIDFLQDLLKEGLVKFI